MRVMVTGGAGYIGSVVAQELIRDGHTVVVYDDLSKGHRAAVDPAAELVVADLRDAAVLGRTLRAHRIEAVVHMAADSLVGESVQRPDKYYDSNMAAGLTLLSAMAACEVRRLVFSSTAAVYGEPARQPIVEDDPTCPSNPYGETKLAFERALPWYERAFGLHSVCLRYFNAAGASERCGEDHEPETHLIPLVLQAAAGRRPHVALFGEDYPTPDGTCVRDYVHVIDLARAHVLALGVTADRSATYNLGCGGAGYSVREVIDVARSITGRPIAVRSEARRPGDPAVLIADSRKIRDELGWQPMHARLEDIVASAWRWMQRHPAGYEPAPRHAATAARIAEHARHDLPS